MDKNKEQKFERILAGLDVVSRNLNALVAVVETLKLELTKDVTARHLLEFLRQMAEKGKIMTREEVKQKFGFVDGIDELIEDLLKSGELFEVRDVLYITDLAHHIPEELLKPKHDTGEV